MWLPATLLKSFRKHKLDCYPPLQNVPSSSQNLAPLIPVTTSRTSIWIYLPNLLLPSYEDRSRLLKRSHLRVTYAPAYTVLHVWEMLSILEDLCLRTDPALHPHPSLRFHSSLGGQFVLTTNSGMGGVWFQHMLYSESDRYGFQSTPSKNICARLLHLTLSIRRVIMAYLVGQASV